MCGFAECPPLLHANMHLPCCPVGDQWRHCGEGTAIVCCLLIAPLPVKAQGSTAWSILSWIHRTKTCWRLCAVLICFSLKPFKRSPLVWSCGRGPLVANRVTAHLLKSEPGCFSFIQYKKTTINWVNMFWFGSFPLHLFVCTFYKEVMNHWKTLAGCDSTVRKHFYGDFQEVLRWLKKFKTQ